MSKITVICGPMFSGKTKGLINEIATHREQNKTVIVFKPLLDNRYSDNEVVSHDKDKVEARNIEEPVEMLQFIDDVDVIAIDEAQFFNDSIVDVVEDIAAMGKDVILAGLDLDYRAEPFGPMPMLLGKADVVKKLHSVCTFCSAPAKYTHRISEDGELVLLGEKDKYVPLCRTCYKELT
ncbi:MAG: thymidine kinase [Crocinitomicaceae bacterium]|nr:thymidine kinase [Crocinitomicaceae bacterium]